MRAILPIFFLFAPILAIGQIPQGAIEEPNPVFDYAINHLDKKSGKGLCLELIVNAENQKYKDWYNDYFNIDSLRAHEIKLEKVAPGDIILFQDLLMEDGREIKYHIGIIFEVEGDTIFYLSQNVGKGKLKEKTIYGQKSMVLKKSRVLGCEINVNKICSGNLYYFHF